RGRLGRGSGVRVGGGGGSGGSGIVAQATGAAGGGGATRRGRSGSGGTATWVRAGVGSQHNGTQAFAKACKHLGLVIHEGEGLGPGWNIGRAGRAGPGQQQRKQDEESVHGERRKRFGPFTATV
nr:hypothetical protein [Tanacetum cinerariifolium]